MQSKVGKQSHADIQSSVSGLARYAYDRPPHPDVLRTSSSTRFGIVTLVCLLLAVLIAAPTNADPERMLLGMAQSLTRDVPESTTKAGLPAIAALVQKSTGIPCTIPDPIPAADLADHLAKDRLQLAIFQGVEFAWERSKHPDLLPLVIVINQQRDRQACLVIRNESTAAHWVDLKNMVLALPKRSREHCHLFLERQCRTIGEEPAEFFSRITAPSTVEDALDDLVEGTIDAAVVDRTGLESYERRKPGRFHKLKVLLTSERFPDSVIAYRAGALKDVTLQQFRQGLLQADKSLVGRHMLAVWMSTAFELPSEEYEKRLREILKVYPVPEKDRRK